MSLKPSALRNSQRFLASSKAGRAKAVEAVNVALIETYWSIGEQLSRKVTEADWGKGIVKELADWLGKQAPDLKEFSASNLWRMRQFYETYAKLPKLATLLRELSWSKDLLLLLSVQIGRRKEFYLLAATRGRWSHRELERQIKKSAFERTLLSELKLATALRVLPENATGVFKDSDLRDFRVIVDCRSRITVQSSRHRCRNNAVNWRTPSKHE
jgi:predicted nuclease of restriction endonuclease-like (RecB) superfamily